MASLVTGRISLCGDIRYESPATPVRSCIAMREAARATLVAGSRRAVLVDAGRLATPAVKPFTYVTEISRL